MEFIESVFEDTKMKWYGEENIKGKAIEAKGRYQGTFYSVKFDTLGVLQDIEMLIDFGTVPENVRTLIEKNLANHFSRFRIQKTQIQ